MKGALQDAVNAYQHALQLDPNNNYAKQNLQYLYQQAQKAHLLKPAPGAPGPVPNNGVQIWTEPPKAPGAPGAPAPVH